MSKKKNKPKFRCKSDAQKKAIAANYARMAAQKRHSTPPSQQPKPQPKKEFKLPLNNGGRRWNIFRVPNSILGGKQDNDVHGGLVLDEMNDNYLLVQVTHSPKKGKDELDRLVQFVFLGNFIINGIRLPQRNLSVLLKMWTR